MVLGVHVKTRIYSLEKEMSAEEVLQNCRHIFKQAEKKGSIIVLLPSSLRDVDQCVLSIAAIYALVEEEQGKPRIHNRGLRILSLLTGISQVGILIDKMLGSVNRIAIISFNSGEEPERTVQEECGLGIVVANESCEEIESRLEILASNRLELFKK